MRTVVVALRPTQAIPRARAHLGPGVSRLLVLTGALIGCWFVCLLLASNAHAAESPGELSTQADAETSDAAGSPEGESQQQTLGVLVGTVSGLLGTAEQHVPSDVDPVLEHADTAVTTIIDTSANTVSKATDAVPGVVDDATDSGGQGLDDLTSVLPANDDAGNDGTGSATTQPSDQPDPDTVHATLQTDHPDVRTQPAQFTRPERVRPARPEPATPVRTTHHERPKRDTASRTAASTDADAALTDTTLTGTTLPTPEDPAFPQPAPPASVSPVASAGQDGSASGRHLSVLDADAPHIARPDLLSTGSHPAVEDARNDPALPHASPG